MDETGCGEPDKDRLQNRVAVVTGGSAGVGRATAEAFAKHGIRGFTDSIRSELLPDFRQPFDRDK